MKSVELKFSRTSTHLVSVRVHKTLGALRGIRSRWSKKKNLRCDAFCYQADKPGRNQVVAEIHLAADNLRLETIAHECCHAAWHRVRLMGLPLDGEDFQEYVAIATGLLTDVLVAWLDKEGFNIKLNVVPRRRVITVGRKR